MHYYVQLQLIIIIAGFWLLHCHVDIHGDEGQSMALQVGELHEMPPVPDNFPRCGSFP